MKLSTRIKQVRRKTGLSQNGLAISLGVSRSAVANWEGPDGSGPTVAHLMKLARAAGISFEWLATGRGPMQPAHDPLLDIVAVDADLVDDSQERRLLRAYRSASGRMRTTLLELVEEMAHLRGGKRTKATHE